MSHHTVVAISVFLLFSLGGCTRSPATSPVVAEGVIMPAYSFKARFVSDIEKGIKRQTIRPRRKRPTRPGDILYLFTGMRTKACRKLCNALCRDVLPIDIFEDVVVLNGQELEGLAHLALAKADGFETIEVFHGFFRRQYGLPLVDKMELIKW